MKKIIFFSIISLICARAQGQWSLTGNAGTNASTNFIGTTDNIAFKIRTKNVVRLTVNGAGKIGIGITTPVFKLDVKGGSINTDSLYRIGGSAVLSIKGPENIFTGSNAGFTNTTGYQNTANGYRALYLNTSGHGNTAIGTSALYTNNTGHYNTAIGQSALGSNTALSYGTAIGYAALSSNTTGRENTAIGAAALSFNTTASENTAIGFRALETQSYSNGNSQWNSGNTAIGYFALYANQPTSDADGIQNTAVGRSALENNTTGAYNTASGHRALYSNTIGFSNSAIGVEALYSNTEGAWNTATGVQALYLNTIADWNTAIGTWALRNNTTASRNTAIGTGALYSQSYANGGNAWNTNNTAIGFEALYFNQPIGTSFGINNTAVGSRAMYLSTSGENNVAIGFQALNNNNDGYNNTAIGKDALYNNANGSRNIAIGYGAGTAMAAPNVFNTISIGNDGYLNGFQNQAFIGNLNTLWTGGNTTWFTYASDARVKDNVKEDVMGLEFISKLRPVTYNLNIEEMRKITGNEETRDYPGKYDVEKIKQSGFIAQEVVKAANETGYNFSGVTIPRNEHELYTMSYSQFVVPLVKAVQELNLKMSEFDDLKIEIENLKSEIRNLKSGEPGINNPKSEMLFQNSPNPFNAQTEIRFMLPSTFSSAQIIINDADGKRVRNDDLKYSSSVIIHASELSAGTYSYSLVVDGVNMETKQMILTK